MSKLSCPTSQDTAGTATATDSPPVILPAPIAAYFVADRSDAAAVAACFAHDAVVKDEGRAYAGISEIRRWKEESSSKYEYTSEPFHFESKEGAMIVASRLTGNFPGSPIDLRYAFKIINDKIAYLEITPCFQTTAALDIHKERSRP